MTMMTLREALTEAIREFSEYGYDRPERLTEWMQRLRALVRQDAPSMEATQKRLKAALETYFKRPLTYRMVRRRHPGVPIQTIHTIMPSLRPELTRRIQASADLIKLNREAAVEKTLQRFAGWASSVPAGGSRVVEKGETKTAILKGLRQLNYEERRVAIDQGHKLMASVDAVIAQQTGAIAAVWRSHWKQPGYDYREDHKERDQGLYLVRGSWAMDKGYLSVAKAAGYTDELTQPAEEPFCRCYWVWLRNLRDLPDDVLTAKGRAVLEQTRIKAA
jgi:hypothetical protein